MKKIIIVVFFAVFFVSCNKTDFGPSLDYINGEAISLKAISGKDDYICKGSYVYKNDTIASKFEIQSKYTLLVVKIDSLSNNYTLKNNENTPYFNVDAQYSVINGDGYEMYYNLNTLNRIKVINSIDLSSDSEITHSRSNDSIEEFHTSFHTLTVSLNGKKDARFYIGDVKDYISADVLFYKKKQSLYFFVLFENKGGSLNNGILYDYLFKK